MSLQRAECRIVVEGLLRVWESEGGFGPDDIEIDGTDLSEVVADLYGVHLNARGSLGNCFLGRVRLTLERLSDQGDE